MESSTINNSVPYVSHRDILGETRSNKPKNIYEDRAQVPLPVISSNNDNPTHFPVPFPPIQRIPPELLQTIFLSAFSSSVEEFHTRKYDTRAKRCIYPILPLELAHTCAAWRTLAYATPELWSLLGIELVDDTTSQSSLPKIIEEWLSRSGPCAITISFCTLPDLSDNKACLETLALFSKKWVDVYLQIPSKLLETFTGLRSADVPLLKTFDAHDEHFLSSFDLAIDKLTFLQNAPSLRALGVPHRLLSFLQIPHTQLSSLILRQFPLDYALGIIRKSLNIEQLQFIPQKGTFWTLSFANVNTTELLQLRELRVEGNAGPLLTFLSCPSLRLANITGRDYHVDYSTIIGIFNSLLVRSGCHLQDLTFGLMSVPRAIVVKCLTLVPTLTTLCINDCLSTFAQIVLQVLTPSLDDPSPLCSQLRRIDIRQCPTIPEDTITEFLLSRCQPINSRTGHLDCVEIINSTENPWPVSIALQDAIKTCREMGVEVRVACPSLAVFSR